MRRKLLLISILIFIAGLQLTISAQVDSILWFTKEIWSDNQGGPITGPVSSSGFYFSDSGYFFSVSTHLTRKSFFSYTDNCLFGTYDYDASQKKISLHIKERYGPEPYSLINTVYIDSVGERISLRLGNAEHAALWDRDKADYVFAMPGNPVLFVIEDIKADFRLNDDERYRIHFDRGFDIDRKDFRRVTDILMEASYRGKDEKWSKGEDKNKYTIALRGTGGYSYAYITFSKDSPFIYVNAEGWLTIDNGLYYEIEPLALNSLVEIAERYIKPGL